MPIYDIINEDNTVTNICKFGVGDVAVVNAKYDSDTINSITFTELEEPEDVGSKAKLTEYEVHHSDVVLTFDNIESLNVVIRLLNKIKHAFEKSAK